jgi:MFS family permease
VDQRAVRRNVLLYRYHAAFDEPLFWGPILITSLQKLGQMSLADIYYMKSAVLCICVLLDIPFGVLADLIGRKRSIVIGRILLLASMICFTSMNSPFYAWVANILWAVGYAMQSGADSALLYETLASNGRQQEYKKIEGQAIGLRLALLAVCSLATGWLAGVDLRLPLWVGLPFMAIPCCTALLFTEPERTRHASARTQLRALKSGAGLVFRSMEVRWVVGFAALLATTSKVWFFAYGPYFEYVHLPSSNLGSLFFVLSLVAWLSSHYAHQIEASLGERGCIVGSVFCIGAPLIAMGYMPIQPFAYLVILQNVVRGFMKPFVGERLNRHVSSESRATVLSVQSCVSNLTGVVGLASLGYFTALYGLLITLMLLGTASLMVGVYSYRSYVRSMLSTRTIQEVPQ